LIGVDGKYIYSFSVGGQTDFLREEDLVEFTLIEEAGNVLPTFLLAFYTSDESILSYFNETNTLQVSFGRTLNEQVTVPLAVQTSTIRRQGQGKRLIQLNGLYGALGYVGDSKKSVHANKDAVSVIREKASTYFNYLSSNVQSSQDSQTWIQPCTNDRKFINELWLHCDLGNGIPAIGITSQGDFILKDIRKEGRNNTKWRFTYQGEQDIDVSYDGDYQFDDSTSFINNWVGYGRKKNIYSIENGQLDELLIKPEPLVAMTNKIARNQDVQSRFAKVGMISKNVHANYWSSALQNLTNLAQLSSNKVTLSFHGKYYPMQVLDKVFFADDELNSDGSAANGYYSGIYFITKVSRSISSRQITHLIELSRESANDVKTV